MSILEQMTLVKLEEGVRSLFVELVARDKDGIAVKLEELHLILEDLDGIRAVDTATDVGDDENPLIKR